MSFDGCLVIERADGWRIVVGSHSENLARDVSPQELVTSVDLMAKLAGLKNPGCVVAPASTSCFFRRLHAGEEIDVRDRSALTYELEDHLPIDAESMVADFVVIPTWPAEQSERDKMVASVAIELDRWHTVADAFELAGIPVRSIVPAPVLASRSLCCGLNLTDAVEFLLIDRRQCDLITVQSETVVDWKYTSVDPIMLRRHKQLDVTEPDRVIVVGADETQQAMLENIYGDIEFTAQSIESHVIHGAELLLADASGRWFDLRRDELGPSDPLRPIRKELRLVTLAAAVCLLALVFGPWWRTRVIETEIANIRSQQQDLFSNAFPDAQIPAALLRRVRSEHARVMGSRGATSQIEVPQSAPEVLRNLLAALPVDVRFRIKSVKIFNGQVDLDLQVRSPVDAGALASSLSSAGFEVKPPVTTQKDAKTFDSLLEAEWDGRAVKPAAQGDVSIRISIGREVTG